MGHKNLAVGGYYLGNHPPLSHKEGRDQRHLDPGKSLDLSAFPYISL